MLVEATPGPSALDARDDMCKIERNGTGYKTVQFVGNEIRMTWFAMLIVVEQPEGLRSAVVLR